MLALRLLEIVRKRLDKRREVTNQDEVVFRVDQLQKGTNVEPPVRSPLQSSIVEVESVNIGDCLQERLQKCRNRLSAVSRPTAKPQGWYVMSLGSVQFKVKAPAVRPTNCSYMLRRYWPPTS